MFATLVNATIEQGVSYPFYQMTMGIMLGAFITVVGFMFNRIQSGFDDAAKQRSKGFDEVGNKFKEVRDEFKGVGDEFKGVRDEFKGVGDEFENVKNKLHQLELNSVKTNTLLELTLLREGVDFKTQEKAIKKATEEFENSQSS
jgi:archaellum component FlaC